MDIKLWMGSVVSTYRRVRRFEFFFPPLGFEWVGEHVLIVKARMWRLCGWVWQRWHFGLGADLSFDFVVGGFFFWLWCIAAGVVQASASGSDRMNSCSCVLEHEELTSNESHRLFSSSIVGSDNWEVPTANTSGLYHERGNRRNARRYALTAIHHQAMRWLAPYIGLQILTLNNSFTNWKSIWGLLALGIKKSRHRPKV